MTKAMRDGLTVLGAAGLGTGLMYLFDPETGTRRRALIRDTVARSTNLTEEAIATTWRDARATEVADCSPRCRHCSNRSR